MSDDPERNPPGGRQLEFNRSNFAASERQLEPLSNEDYEASDEESGSLDEVEEYPSYTDELADYQPAPEDLFDEPVDTEPAPRWDESSVEAAMRWHEEPEANEAPAESEFDSEGDDDAAPPEYDAEPVYDSNIEDEPAYAAEPVYEPESTPAAPIGDSPVALNLGQFNDPENEMDRFTDEPDASKPAHLPLGLLATAAVALCLLAAGGYGVMQQRAAMQEEIRLLQSRLATADANATTPRADTRLAELEQALAGLDQDNRMLQMDNAALEEKLAALQAARRLSEAEGETAAQRAGAFGSTAEPEKTAEVTPAPAASTNPVSTGNNSSDSATAVAAPVPKPDAAPATTAKAPAAASGPWFVNFAAYSREADARTRADSLKVSAGTVRVLSVDVDGRTLYRVRITGLPDRQRADALARELESNYGVGRLWVGKN